MLHSRALIISQAYLVVYSGIIPMVMNFFILVSCLFKEAHSRYFELFWPRTKWPLDERKPVNSSLLRSKNTKEILIERLSMTFTANGERRGNFCRLPSAVDVMLKLSNNKLYYVNTSEASRVKKSPSLWPRLFHWCVYNILVYTHSVILVF